MTKTFYEIRRSLRFRRRHWRSTLRLNLSHFIYLFVTSLSLQTAGYFRAAYRVGLNATPKDPEAIDMTSQFTMFLDLFSISNWIILIGLVIFALFSLSIGLNRQMKLNREEFSVKYLSGSSPRQLTLELMLRELIGLPIIFAVAYSLATYFYHDIAGFFNWALPAVSKIELSTSLTQQFFNSLVWLILILSIFGVFFIIRMKRMVTENFQH